MLVETIMSSDVAVLQADASVDSAMDLMDSKDVRHVPITEDGQLVGVLSDRDLLAATGWIPVDQVNAPQWHTSRPHSVRQVMHAPVKTLSPADQLVSASLELVLHGIGCMPVVSNGNLVGIVTEIDLLRAFVRASQQGLFSEQDHDDVRTLMTSDVITVDAQTPMLVARNHLQKIHAHHLPVVDHGRALIGLVSDRDLRRASGRGLSDGAPVSDVMSTAVVSIAPDRALSEAAALMVERKFGALPVVEDGRLVGILTSTDLLDECMNTLWEPEVFEED